jgi:hypothetical protein
MVLAASMLLRMPVIAQTPASAQLASGSAGENRAAATGPNPAMANSSRIYIKDPFVRDAVGRTLARAAAWLQAPKCQALLTEFSDRQGRALTERLAELKMSLAEYLSAIIVEDGERHPRCGNEGVLAFTVVGSRIIHVCGHAFVRATKRDAEEAQATIIHELLHSLGLGENPPSPRQITYRVRELCW